MAQRQRSRKARPQAATETNRPLLIAVGVLVLATVAVFGRVVFYDFVSIDDDLHILDNPHMKPVSLANVLYFWLHQYGDAYFPLSYTFWSLEAWLAALPPGEYGGRMFDPAVFHAGCLLLHLVCVLLVFAILRRLTESVAAACCGALVFALHPLQVESVAWISETRGLLAALFSLLALLEYLDYATASQALAAEPVSRDDERRLKTVRTTSYLLGSLAFVLAMLSKTSAAAVPLVAAILDVVILRRDWRKVMMAVAPWLVIAMLFALGMKRLQGDELIDFVPPWWARPMIAADALEFYFEKLLMPLNLSIHYPRTPQEVMASPRFWWSLAAPVAIAALLIGWRRRRFLVAGVLAMIAGVAPVLGLVPFAFQNISTVADRYAYLAMLGPALALAGLMATANTKKVTAAAIAVIVVCGALSLRQVEVWHDTGTLFGHALALHPESALAHRHLAVYALQSGDSGAALEHADALLREHPESTGDRMVRALALSQLGRHAEAAKEYEAIVAVEPRNADARLNLAAQYYGLGRTEDAQRQYREILKYESAHPAANRRLAAILAEEGETDEALAILKRVVAQSPEDAAALADLAQVLATSGRAAEAVEAYQKALARQPADWTAVAGRLAWILATSSDDQVRRPAEAVRLAEAASVQSNEQSPELLTIWAAALAASGDYPRAMEVTGRAHRLAVQAGQSALVERIEELANRFQAGQPWRQQVSEPAFPQPSKPGGER
jgi:tetratricopeptide (TPR) repeat protein